MINLTKNEIENLEFIGAGNFGSVYRKDNIAYKIYKDKVTTSYGEYTKNPSLKYKSMRLNRLIKKGYNIQHTNLIKDVIFVDGIFKGVTYPYCDGSTLDTIILYPMKKKIDIAKQLVKNASELTDNHIYPTDYKLKNIVLQDEQVRIIDLDDYFTKVHLIPNYIHKRKSITTLDKTIKTYFYEYRHYSVHPEIRNKVERCFPIQNKTYKDINSYIDEKSIPFNYIFVDDNSNVCIIKDILKNKQYRVIYVYDKNKTDAKRVLNAIKNYNSNGIIIYDIIEAHEVNRYITCITYDDCIETKDTQLVKKI